MSEIGYFPVAMVGELRERDYHQGQWWPSSSENIANLLADKSTAPKSPNLNPGLLFTLHLKLRSFDMGAIILS
jgi:hypothetical protein